jgi:hypothetical protein
MEWAYGVTTTPKRKNSVLPQTLASLARAGFDAPHLFVDACPPEEALAYKERYKNLPLTTRWPRINVYGNWILSMAELYIRNPKAVRYAIFQDDLLMCGNLRKYLELCPYPKLGYWNLYTFPQRERVCPRVENTTDRITGWYHCGHRGLGALALVFSKEAVTTLLTHQNTILKPLAVKDSFRTVDGMVVTSMQFAGYKEYVHYPSLVQHMGVYSTMDKRQNPVGPFEHLDPFKWHPKTMSRSFPGEHHDAMKFLEG